MTCPCGHHFCWYCYRDHQSGPTKRFYEVHTVQECIFIFISKILLVLFCICNLVIIFNGNEILKDVLSIIFNIIIVALETIVLDTFFILQICLIFSRNKIRRYALYKQKWNNKIVWGGCILLNAAVILLLYFFGILELCFIVLGIQFMIFVLGFSVGYGIIYTI